MITKFFTKVAVKFDPFSASAKSVRLFLARIPSAQKSGCQISYQVVKANEEPQVKVTYKDKLEKEVNPENKSFEDLRAIFDAHSRKLALQSAIEE